VAVIEPARRAPLTERIQKRHEGDALLNWLTLLGWKVELDRDEDLFVAVARHVTRDGSELGVAATATTRVDVVWTLFERAVGKIGSTDADRGSLERRDRIVAAPAEGR
jgi:hypothetical protein